jgi:hypothetical protein
MPRPAALSIFSGFALAFAGWLTIYFAIHSRRRRDALQLESRSSETQLRSPLAQINPHFLFNCLNSLRHLICRRPDRAEAMVTGLRRSAIAARPDRHCTVTLAEELRVIDGTRGRAVRFEERLRRARRGARSADVADSADAYPDALRTTRSNTDAEPPAGGVMRMVVHRVDDAWRSSFRTLPPGAASA